MGTGGPFFLVSMRKSSLLAQPCDTSMASQRPSGERPDVGPVLEVPPLAEQPGLLVRIVAQAVLEDAAVVLVLARRHRALGRVAGVVEALAVGLPGQRAVAGPGDLVGRSTPLLTLRTFSVEFSSPLALTP
jgi:hypothetical protein